MAIVPVKISRGSPSPHRPLIFISHSFLETEHPLFQRLINDLKRDPRVRLWYPPDRLNIGDELYATIQQAIRESDFHLFIIPKTPSTGVGIELQLLYSDQLASGRAKLILARLHDGAVPRMLQAMNCVDFTTSYESTLENLINETVAASQPALVQFALDQLVDALPIVEVTDKVGARLVKYFTEHPEDMRTMDRRLFEKLVAEMFRGFGYDVELTQQTRDGGRDIIAIRRHEVNTKYLIECKRPDPGGYVGIRPVRELYGVKCDEMATKAILATTAYFSPDALLFFENHKWELESRDYEGLLDWLHAYKTIEP